MYLVLVEEVDNQWIVWVDVRFMCWVLWAQIPIGCEVLRLSSASSLSSLGWVLRGVPRPCRGVRTNGFFYIRTVVVVPILHRLILRWWWRLVKDVSISRQEGS